MITIKNDSMKSKTECMLQATEQFGFQPRKAEEVTVKITDLSLTVQDYIEREYRQFMFITTETVKLDWLCRVLPNDLLASEYHHWEDKYKYYGQRITFATVSKPYDWEEMLRDNICWAREAVEVMEALDDAIEI